MGAAEAAQLDLRAVSEACGGPSLVSLLQRDVARLGPGEVLEVLTGAADQTFTVTAWCRKNGVPVVSQTPQGRGARIQLGQPAQDGHH